MKSRRVEGKLADFEIRDLRASVEGKEILKGVTLAINNGEVHAVMGPNGSGKSTLSHTLMGHPGYTVDGGEVIFKGQNVLTLKPEIAILDETDSGLDIDSIKFVADAVNRMRGPELGVLIITHYTRILQFIKPDFVHVLVDGKFVLSGGPEVADRLEKTGYSEWAEADEPAVLKPEEVA